LFKDVRSRKLGGIESRCAQCRR